MGDQDVVEALLGPGRFEGRAVEALRGEPRDDPPLDRDGPTRDRDLAAGARGYAPRPLVAHKLDPYKAIIDARLEAFPKLSAKRLFDEVRAAGYPGGYGRVRDVRACDPAARARRGAGPVRDAAGAPGPGGLRDVHASLGPAPEFAEIGFDSLALDGKT